MAVPPSFEVGLSQRLPWSCFQPPSLKFRTAGFPQYGFKHQAPVSSARVFRSKRAAEVRSRHTPPDLSVGPSLRDGLGHRESPPRCAEPGRLTIPPGPRGPRSGWVLISDPHRLSGLIRRSGDLPPLPSRAGYRPALDIQGSSCLVSRPSELSLPDSPGLPSSTSAGSPMRAHPHFFRTGIGHRVKGGSSWHSNNPLESASCGSLFRRLVRSLSLRPSWLFAPWTDPTETVRCLSGRLGLLHPGFQPTGHPAKLPGIATAPHGDLRRRDSHPQVGQLASLRSFPRLA